MLRMFCCKPSHLPVPPRLKALGWGAVLSVAIPASGALAQEPAPAAPVPAPVAVAPTQEPLPQTHTVKKGDTLWDLAQFYLHDPFLWPGIYRLNTDVVEDPHWIYPGEVLRIAPTDNVAAVPTMDTPLPSAPLEGAQPTASADSTGTVVPDSSTDALAQGPQQPSMAESEQNEMAPLFPERKARSVEEMLKAYTHQTYRPLRRSEFYSSGFLTENQRLPVWPSAGTGDSPADPGDAYRGQCAAVHLDCDRRSGRRHVRGWRQSPVAPAGQGTRSLRQHRDPHRRGPDHREL